MPSRAVFPSLIKFLVVLVLLNFAAGAVVAQDGNPDLQVQDPPTALPIPDETATPPQEITTVEQGQTVTIIAQVFNSSTTPVTSTDLIDVEFQILDSIGNSVTIQDGSIVCTRLQSPTDPSRCAVPASSIVNPQARVEVRATIDTTSIPVAPSYTVFVVADPDNEITEEAEDNNGASIQFSVNSVSPNLLIPADFAFSPTSPRQGDLVTVQFELVNDRLVDVSVPFNIAILLRKEISENLYEPFITLSEPGVSCSACRDTTIQRTTSTTITAQIPSILLDPGNYQLQIQADSTNALEEGSEIDNTLTIDFTLQQPVRNLVLSNARPNPLFAQQGNVVSFNFDVTNTSTAAAENVSLQLLLDGLPQEVNSESGEATEFDQPTFTCSPATAFVNINGNSNGARSSCTSLLSIGPNETISINAQFSTADLPLGDFAVLVNLDQNDAFTETNETDNSLAYFLTIGTDPAPAGPVRGPELHPVSLELVPDSPVTQGASILVTTNIKNSGNQNAEDVEVRFSVQRQDGAATSCAFDTSNGSSVIDLLKIGIDIDVKATLQTANCEPGVYFIRVDVLSPNETELDENNNSIRAEFSIEE